MRTVTASMPKDLVAELDAIAAREERSRSKIIEMILRDELERSRLFPDTHPIQDQLEEEAKEMDRKWYSPTDAEHGMNGPPPKKNQEKEA